MWALKLQLDWVVAIRQKNSMDSVNVRFNKEKFKNLLMNRGMYNNAYRLPVKLLPVVSLNNVHLNLKHSTLVNEFGVIDIH
ncbi:Uncharacterized protein APZ42_030923 [Daphnia magna]|uniref:Uncharacterized protein n=1 Tax=Daphnia magna TaxID=35525 RepID=A0A164NFA6_9CRUS|nr:Uncharacterized protein APZ42_030923 [Daphnia magna]